MRWSGRPSIEGDRRHCAASPSMIEEEYDEFWAAIKADDFAQARREVLQLAAMCLAYLLEVA